MPRGWRSRIRSPVSQIDVSSPLPEDLEAALELARAPERLNAYTRLTFLYPTLRRMGRVAPCSGIQSGVATEIGRRWLFTNSTRE